MMTEKEQTRIAVLGTKLDLVINSQNEIQTDLKELINCTSELKQSIAVHKWILGAIASWNMVLTGIIIKLIIGG